MKRWINGHKLRAVWTRAGADAAISRAHPNSPIYMLEEEDMQRVSPPESDQEAYERNERIGTAAWAEVARLKPIVSRPLGEPVPVEDEAVRMRRVIEAMRPIVEAALGWVDAWEMCGRGSPQGKAMKSAVDANRERLEIAMSASQTIGQDEELRAAAKAWLVSPVSDPVLDPIDGRLASALRVLLGWQLAANAGRVR